jgi:hypothetical protein
MAKDIRDRPRIMPRQDDNVIGLVFGELRVRDNRNVLLVRILRTLGATCATPGALVRTVITPNQMAPRTANPHMVSLRRWPIGQSTTYGPKNYTAEDGASPHVKSMVMARRLDAQRAMPTPPPQALFADLIRYGRMAGEAWPLHTALRKR